MTVPRKERKNEKDGGGIVAAVTRHHQQAAAASRLGVIGGGSSSSGSESSVGSESGASASAGGTPNPAQSPALTASSPPMQSSPVHSPEIRFATTTHHHQPYKTGGGGSGVGGGGGGANSGNNDIDGLPAASPRLFAASAPSISGTSVPSTNNEWIIRSGYPGSPGNTTSIMGESPPTLPSSYEDPGRLLRQPRSSSAASSHVDSHAASPSPPGAMRRPLSTQIDPHFKLADPNVNPPHGPASAVASVNTATAAAYRRSAVQPHLTQHARAGSHSHSHPPPPLPHLAQAHFYGAPDIDFGALSPQSGMKAGERGYHFGFDTLPRRQHWEDGPSGGGGGLPAGSEKVVVAGYEGGLEVYAVGRRGLDHVGGLRGLRGGVVHAKILPWLAESDPAGLFPLVAVVVHGPVLPQATTPGATSSTAATAAAGAVNTTRPAVGGGATAMAMRGVGGHVHGHAWAAPPAIESYQTTVEVYSLRTSRSVAVLLAGPVIPISAAVVSVLSPMFRPPPPTGAFTIRADAGTVVVASGVTGECWIHRQIPVARVHHLSLQQQQQAGAAIRFGCVAKVWTSIQQSTRALPEERDPLLRQLSSSSAAAWSYSSPPQTPIIALNGRWVAYCPAAPSSQIALRAQVPVGFIGKAPGLSTVTPPPVPSTTAGLDLPSPESVVNKIMRETTQELISGARWVGQQGIQAWNSYWNKSASSASQQQQQQQPSRSPPGPSQPQQQAPPQLPGQFPPTHGTTDHVAREPGLVSIIDLETVGHSTSLHPVVTFAPSLGCSFLSFSPAGLSLFTASGKGDVQTVWDLMRVQHTKASPLQAAVAGGSVGPQVRQVAQFSRMTVARIVEVVWTRPGGERIAMVTERGTVHLLDLPASAFVWPAPRRRRPDAGQDAAGGRRAQEHGADGGGGGGGSGASGAAASIASSAIGVALGAAKPLIARQRRSSGGGGGGLGVTGTNIVDSANHGGRAIAATISNSLGKTSNALSQLRLTVENRVSLPPGPTAPSPSCAIWVAGRKYRHPPTLFVLGGGGTVRAFLARPSRRYGDGGGGGGGGGGSGAAAAASSSSRGRRLSGRSSKYREFRVPPLPDGAIAPLVKSFLELGAQDDVMYLDLSDKEEDGGGGGGGDSSGDADVDGDFEGGHTTVIALDPPAARLPRVAEPDVSAEAAIPQAEIESSAPYQPFHTDRRVSLLECAEGSAVGPGGAWAFGQPMDAVRLDLGHHLPPSASSFLEEREEEESEPGDGRGHRALPASAMERVMRMGGSGGGAGRLHDGEIVVTTRRRRRHHAAGPDEDGFFEDDCEVLDFADQRV